MKLYKRLFAKGLAKGDPYQDKVYGERKKRLFAELRGNVLEIGAGTGVNLPFIPKDVHWTGIDPNPFMHRFVLDKADQLNLQIDVQLGDAEHLGFEANHFDCVISTLVLCSVPNPDKALMEIKRVLKPGGQFVFIEHVAAPKGTLLRGIQKTIKPAWKLVADGCRPDRELGKHIEEAAFSELNIEPFNYEAPVSLIKPHIMGWGTK